MRSLLAASAYWSGRWEDRLDWAFQLSDIDGDGKISYDEVRFSFWGVFCC